ncbi:MAG: ABC transporter permease subunit [Bacteroidia bacterium]|nr:ABC transporter permease subunit [Bacteroidia bacterium]
MNKVIKYVIIDILRSKIVLAYTLLLLIISFSVFSLEGNSTKGLLSLLNLILFIVPLVSIIFSTIYIYNSAEFIELLVSQPLKRKNIWSSLFSGLSVSLSLAFLVGTGLPIMFYEPSATGYVMVLVGCFLSVIFVGIAMLASVINRDKAKGIGAAILIWLYFALIFDGLVLFLLFQLSDYPLEKPMMIISGLNPIDLSRITVLLRLDESALMGYTGAVFKDFFGTNIGFITTLISLIIWILIPFAISLRRFKHKDL